MRLRYFFDAGSGICLWAADDEARLTYGYPIDLEQIPISLELRNYGSELITRFDKCIDWSNPGSSSPWSISQKDEFLTDARKFFTTLSSQLYESHTIIWAISI